MNKNLEFQESFDNLSKLKLLITKRSDIDNLDVKIIKMCLYKIIEMKNQDLKKNLELFSFYYNLINLKMSVDEIIQNDKKIIESIILQKKSLEYIDIIFKNSKDNYIEILNFFYSKSNFTYFENLIFINKLLILSSEYSNNKNIIKCIDSGAFEINQAIIKCIKRSNIVGIKILLEKLENENTKFPFTLIKKEINYLKYLEIACEFSNIFIINLFISKITKPIDFNYLMSRAAIRINDPISKSNLHYLLSLQVKDDYKYLLEQLLNLAINGNEVEFNKLQKEYSFTDSELMYIKYSVLEKMTEFRGPLKNIYLTLIKKIKSEEYDYYLFEKKNFDSSILKRF